MELIITLAKTVLILFHRNSMTFIQPLKLITPLISHYYHHEYRFEYRDSRVHTVLKSTIMIMFILNATKLTLKRQSFWNQGFLLRRQITIIIFELARSLV